MFAQRLMKIRRPKNLFRPTLKTNRYQKTHLNTRTNTHILLITVVTTSSHLIVSPLHNSTHTFIRIYRPQNS